MGLRLTTKTTVSGWRFLLRRLEHALVRRDTRMFDDPLQFYGRSVAAGIVAAVIILVGAGVMAFFKPQGKLGSSTLVVDRTTNQLFLIVSGQLHPVYNLTSARLVLGNPATPTPVKSSELSSLPRGQTIGIPGAPYATPVSSDSTSNWALCDTVTNAASVNPGLQTAVVAMPLVTDTSVGPIQPDQAVLASYQGQEWVMTQNGRYTLDRTNRALTQALGMSANAKPSPVSQGIFNALANLGSMQLPPITDAGAPNSIGLPPDLVIGSVFQTQAESGTQFYVVLRDGIAPVTAPTAAALRATNSFGFTSPPTLEPSLVINIAERDFASPLPDSTLRILSREDAPTLCWSWERKTGDQAPKTTVIAGRHLPLPSSAMNTGIQQIQGTATVYIDGGKFIRLQSPDPRYGESLYYVDPQGVRYGLPNEQTAGTIGLSKPQNAPWEIVRLLVDGPVLSQENALLEHDTLPADPSPRNVAPGTSEPGATQ